MRIPESFAIAEKEGMKFLGWREVPTAPEVLGHKARECMPVICQGFVKKPENIAAGLDFDRKLYVVRRVFEQSNDNTYVPSLSSRTIVYKGMFLVGQLRTFFKDLQDAEYDSAIAIVHSRFSIRIPAGSVHIRTGLLCITVRSIRSRAMRIRCWRGRKQCVHRGSRQMI